MEKIKHLDVVFTSDERRNKEIDTRIGKLKAVPRKLYLSVVTKRELSNTVTLLVFKSVFVPIIIYGLERCILFALSRQYKHYKYTRTSPQN